ncbi:MAG: hypothetical protein RML14_12645 [Meiothermus sp.]|uniref:hypothetical protein n=1 Tax=Meiothermus sp. TaxID=1955249 RepID=UPI00298F311B|nr:hypothetical protein [Meiothermus sp.]MDW8482682.1 hypothetical protein [Meiothermus sp.]
MELPANLPDELRAKLEALSKTSPSLAQTILRAWQAREGRPNPAAAESLAQPAPTPTPPPAPSPVSTPPTPSPDWREVRAFEWQDLLKKAEETLRSEGDWERLGPLAPLVRLLVAQALRHGARNDPSREAHVFLAQWEVCQFSGISTRTLERWLGDPRYAPYREVAQDWSFAWADLDGLGRGHQEQGPHQRGHPLAGAGAAPPPQPKAQDAGSGPLTCASPGATWPRTSSRATPSARFVSQTGRRDIKSIFS